MIRLMIALFVAGGVGVGAHAQSIKIGTKAPTFKDLPSATPADKGKKFSLGDFKKDVLVVCITCNHCPVAVAYEKKIVDFVKNVNDKKVDFVAINVNNLLDSDKFNAMKIRAQGRGFNFPYLFDPSGKIGKALGATVTPEFWVFDKNRKLVYHGPFDNRKKKTYLSDAVEAVVAGRTPKIQNVAPFGCGVMYADE